MGVVEDLPAEGAVNPVIQVVPHPIAPLGPTHHGGEAGHRWRSQVAPGLGDHFHMLRHGLKRFPNRRTERVDVFHGAVVVRRKTAADIQHGHAGKGARPSLVKEREAGFYGADVAMAAIHLGAYVEGQAFHVQPEGIGGGQERRELADRTAELPGQVHPGCGIGEACANQHRDAMAIGHELFQLVDVVGYEGGAPVA